MARIQFEIDYRMPVLRYSIGTYRQLEVVALNAFFPLNPNPFRKRDQFPQFPFIFRQLFLLPHVVATWWNASLDFFD